MSLRLRGPRCAPARVHLARARPFLAPPCSPSGTGTYVSKLSEAFLTRRWRARRAMKVISVARRSPASSLVPPSSHARCARSSATKRSSSSLGQLGQRASAAAVEHLRRTVPRFSSISASMRSSTVPRQTNLWTSTFRCLADAEGAVGGLVLDGRVPPAVEVDDVRGGGQVQAVPPALSESTKKGGPSSSWKRSTSVARLLDRRPAVQDQAGAAEDRRRGSAASGSVISRNWVKTSSFSCRAAIARRARAGAASLPLVPRVAAAVAEPLRRVVADLLEAHERRQHEAAALDAVDRRRGSRASRRRPAGTARPAGVSAQ